jgi:MoaA/NifB/PqqE/SkfB family radical SAM enzyme
VNKGFNVSVIYTVSRFNIDALFEMPALLVELGVKRFFIQVIGIRGKTAQQRQDNWQLRPAEWLDKVPPVAKAAADFGIHVIYPKVFLDSDEVFECAGVVAENFFIFPNGRVYLCPLVEDYPLHTYNIENGKLMRNEGLVEENLFTLNIPEGCVMNKLLQPDNLQYTDAGLPCYRISCCLLKQEMKRA